MLLLRQLRGVDDAGALLGGGEVRDLFRGGKKSGLHGGLTLGALADGKSGKALRMKYR